MTSSVRTACLMIAELAVVIASSACRKKAPEARPADEQNPAATSSVPVVESAPTTSASAPAPEPREDERDAELTLFHELALGEGKELPAPKLEKASPEATKEHQKKLTEVHARLAKERCAVTQTIGASHAASTYLQCAIAGKRGEGARLTEEIMTHVPDRHWLYAVEGTDVAETELATVPLIEHGPPGKGSPATYSLMITPKGYFHRISGDLGFVLRRDTGPMPTDVDGPEPARIECLGKKWQDGRVSNVEVPSFFVRARDVDGDGREEQPAAIFQHDLEDWYLSAPAMLDQVCNVPSDGRLTIAVAGVEGSLSGGKLSSESLRPFYERRLKAARARAQKIREWAGLSKLVFDGDASAPAGPPPTVAPKAITRIKEYSGSGSLRLTNECALDVAQVAAQLVIYARVLGAEADRALVDADALMAGFSLRADKCGGLEFKGAPTDRELDHWPVMRTALVGKP